MMKFDGARQRSAVLLVELSIALHEKTKTNEPVR
jgi:hypothetical protein